MITITSYEAPFAEQYRVPDPELTDWQLAANARHAVRLRSGLGKLGLLPILEEWHPTVYQQWRERCSPEPPADLPLGFMRSAVVEKDGGAKVLVNYSQASERATHLIPGQERARASIVMYYGGKQAGPQELGLRRFGLAYDFYASGEVVADGCVHPPQAKRYQQVEQMWNDLGMDLLVPFPDLGAQEFIHVQSQSLIPDQVGCLADFIIDAARWSNDNI